MPSAGYPDTADAIVVGGGTVGAWCAYFLRRSGLDRVVLLEKRTLGEGASSRAAGIVRTQGGTPWAVQLGDWSRKFYLRQHDELGIDSGFIPQGYLRPASPPRTSPPPATGWPCRTPRACRSAGWSPPKWTLSTRRWRRG